MFGAQALVATLADCGVRACFANPGTSEMHLVAALDREPRIRSVLAPVTLIVSLALRIPFTRTALAEVSPSPRTAMANTNGGVRRSSCKA
jgi:hypothetical protein